MDTQYGELIPLDFAEDAVHELVPVQIMRAGTFTEMHGRQVEITEDDLEAYVSNFTAGLAGQELPVFTGHPPEATRHAEPAAGWFRKVYTRLLDGVKTLWADIELTEMGRDLLRKKLYKYLSPTLNLSNKLLLGGGFVNLPAIKGQPAIEMSQFLWEATMESERTFMQRIADAVRDFVRGGAAEGSETPAPDTSDMAAPAPPTVAAVPATLKHTDGGDTMDDVQLAELRDKIRGEVEAEFAGRKQEMADFAEKIRTEEREKVIAELAERQKLEGEVAEFAASVCGGDAGLSAPVDEVKAFLLTLTPEQREAAKKLLSQKVVDFSEQGHQGAGVKSAVLAPEALAGLRMHLAASEKPRAEAIAAFCAANELDMADYDLSEFLPAAA
jgi:hypothetical protein